MSKTCKTCVHLDRPSMTCHRYPPQVAFWDHPDQGRILESHWPSTGPDQTCGEHILVPREWSAPNRTTRS